MGNVFFLIVVWVLRYDCWYQSQNSGPAATLVMTHHLSFVMHWCLQYRVYSCQLTCASKLNIIDTEMAISLHAVPSSSSPSCCSGELLWAPSMLRSCRAEVLMDVPLGWGGKDTRLACEFWLLHISIHTHTQPVPRPRPKPPPAPCTSALCMTLLHRVNSNQKDADVALEHKELGTATI